MARSKKSKAGRAQGDRTGRQRGKFKRRRRSRSGSSSFGWLAGTVVALVVVIVGFNFRQGGVFARPLEASRMEAVSDLLPLAEGRWPLTGGHDMARIPSETPVPGTRPEGIDLPRVELPSSSHDFGRVAKRPDVAHIFALQNTGTADLVVSNLVTSCGCTQASLSSSIIPPGQRADLTVTFDPDFHPTQGLVTRLVWFATNDPEQPWVEVRIAADVI